MRGRGTLAGIRASARARPELPAGRVVVPCREAGFPFRWRIDPYPGFDPAFPLGRGSPSGVERTWPGAGAAGMLARDLRGVREGERIALGARADPWPVEETARGRTRMVLEALTRRDGLTVSITSRSELVTGDLDRLVDLARRHRVEVNVVIATLDRRLAAALEPGSPRPDLRLRATSEIAAAGVPVGALVSPVVPWVTDHPDALEALAAAVAGAGGRWIRAIARMPLPGRLISTFPGLEAASPDLVDRYRDAHGRCPISPERYETALEEFVKRTRSRHGLSGGSRRDDGTSSGDDPQLPLL